MHSTYLDSEGGVMVVEELAATRWGGAGRPGGGEHDGPSSREVQSSNNN